MRPLTFLALLVLVFALSYIIAHMYYTFIIMNPRVTYLPYVKAYAVENDTYICIMVVSELPINITGIICDGIYDPAHLYGTDIKYCNLLANICHRLYLVLSNGKWIPVKLKYINGSIISVVS